VYYLLEVKGNYWQNDHIRTRFSLCTVENEETVVPSTNAVLALRCGCVHSVVVRGTHKRRFLKKPWKKMSTLNAT